MFPFFKPLTPECYCQYKCYLEKMDGKLPSSLYFPSLIAWDFTNKNYYEIIQEYFCIAVEHRLHQRIELFEPVGVYHPQTFEAMMNILFEQLKNSMDRLIFCDVTEDKLPFFKGMKGFYIDRLVSERKNADYLYTASAFSKALDKPQARYNRNYFIRKNNPVCVPMGSSLKDECYSFTELNFCRYHQCRDCIYGCEKELIKILLKDYDVIGAQGIGVMTDGHLAGYGIGARQGETLAYLFKKSIRSLRGINEYIHFEILKRFGKGCGLINYTEDLDMDGLRDYKARLAPFILSPRYEVTIRKGRNENGY